MGESDKKKISNNQIFQQVTFTWHNINARLPEKKQNNSKLPCCKPSKENSRNQIIDNGIEIMCIHFCLNKSIFSILSVSGIAKPYQIMAIMGVRIIKFSLKYEISN